MQNPKMSRAWAMPSGDTFSIKPIAELLDRYLADAKVVVDPFARNATRGTITNDLNPTTSAQRHLHAEEFAIALAAENVVADVVLFDPPYTLRQIKECYEGVGRGFTQYDHATGRVRGLLCASCNSMAGILEKVAQREMVDRYLRDGGPVCYAKEALECAAQNPSS